MDIMDLVFFPSTDLDLKHAVLDLAHQYALAPTTPVVIPTDTNDDVNGSQHVREGGTDFTYRDAVDADLDRVHSLGYYEYFSRHLGAYTGHYYQGDRRHFEALVLNPPAYAASAFL